MTTPIFPSPVISGGKVNKPSIEPGEVVDYLLSEIGAGNRKPRLLFQKGVDVLERWVWIGGFLTR